MIVVKLLGLLDLACVFAIFFALVVPQRLMMLLAIYLMGKGSTFAFGGDRVSYIDVICGIYMLLLAFSISNPIISGLFIAYMGQKAIFSLM